MYKVNRLFRTLLMVFLVSSGMLAGCQSGTGNIDEVATTIGISTTIETSTTIGTTTSIETIHVSQSQSQSSQEAFEAFTPYQYLTLALGNTEAYAWRHVDQAGSEGWFYGNESTLVHTYWETNMHGKGVFVKEVFEGPYHYFVIPHQERVLRYDWEGHTGLFFKMLEAAYTVPDLVLFEDGLWHYQHRLPFIHDESMSWVYDFYMDQEGLRILSIALEGEEGKTYTFDLPLVDAVDAEVFNLPKNFSVENINGPYDDGQIPPWYE